MTNISSIKESTVAWFSEASGSIKNFGKLCGRTISDKFSSIKNSATVQNIFQKTLENSRSAGSFLVDNKKIIGGTVVVASAVFIIAVIAFRAFKTYKATQNHNATLQTKVADLTTEKTHLENQVNTLILQNTALQAEVTTLNGENATLETQVTTLNGEKATLQTQVTTLITENTALQTQVTTLTTENTALQAKATTLNSEKGTLETELNNLQASNAQKTGWWGFSI